MKFIIGVAVGWFLFHPLKEDSKFDQLTRTWLDNGGKKAADYLTKKIDKATGS